MNPTYRPYTQGKSPRKKFLSLEPSFSSYVLTRALRGCSRGGFFLSVSLRFKAKENLERCEDSFFYKETKGFYPSYVLIHFENLIGVWPDIIN